MIKLTPLSLNPTNKEVLMIAHKPLKTYHYLKQLSTYLSLIFVALVLVGCASNKSTGVTAGVTSGDTPDETVDTVEPEEPDDVISALTLDNFLNNIPSEIRTRANSISIPTRKSAAPFYVYQSSSPNSLLNGDSVEDLLVEIEDIVTDPNRPVYSLDYFRTTPNTRGNLSDFSITTDSPLLSVEHATSNVGGINLKQTAIHYKVSGANVIDGDFYFQIYTNHGETHDGTMYGDSNYLAMGNWLFVPETRTDTASYGVGSFANADNGDDTFVSGTEIQSIIGTGTYTGAAHGFALLYNEAGTETEALALSGVLRLNANFDMNTISGSISDFAIRGGGATTIASTSQIDLAGTANSLADVRGGFGQIFSRTVGGSLEFTTSSGTRSHTYSGSWNSYFYGHEPGSHPRSVSGTLAATSGSGDSATDDTQESALHLSLGAYRD